MDIVGQFVENLFELLGKGAQKHEIAGGTVHIGHTWTASFPDITDLTKHLRIIEFAGCLVDTNSMEMGYSRELFGNIRITADNSTAISENTDDTAVFPMGDLIIVGKLELSENIPASFIFLGLPFNVLDKTRPGTAFQLIQQVAYHALASLFPP